MKFIVNMMWLGLEPKTSKKSGKAYFMAKMMNTETSEIFEMYVSGEDLPLIQKASGVKIGSVKKVSMKLSAYRGEARVDFADIEG
jgi:hypothetical protein